MSVGYDAGALIAADRSNRAVWADHRVRLERDLIPLTTTPVVAQVSRSGRQVQLRRFLRGCRVVTFAPEEAHQVGALAGRAGIADVIDVHLVLVAHRAAAGVLSADPDDLMPVSAALPSPVPIFPV